MKFFYFVLLLTVQFGAFCRANESSVDPIVIKALLQEASDKKLAQNPYWLNLNYYHPKGNQFQSDVINKDFFIAADGLYDPEHELVATVYASLNQIPGDPNQHAQCKYIARYQWLKSQLHWPEQYPQANCTKYNAWSRSKTKKASLVFATGYLKNPASFYGHVLLRFHDGDSEITSSALDTSINYGALVNENDKGLTYIFKGLFGGYEAAFSDGLFYHYNYKYGESQLRNLWDYELNLSEAEVKQLSFHAWELLQAKFSYYFVEKNCAYHLAKQIELVTGKKLTGNAPWVAPASIFFQLMETDYKNAPLVKQVTYIPSRQSRYVEEYQSLNGPQKKAAVAWATTRDDSKFKQLPAAQQTAVVDTLLDNTEFLLLESNNNSSLKELKRQLLITRLNQAAQTSNVVLNSENQPPHTGDKVSLASASLINNSRFGLLGEWRLRPANFDFLSLDSGRTPFTTLEMFDIHLLQKDKRFWLRTVDLVNIQTLNPRNTDLPGEKNYGWEISGGITPESLACWNCSLLNLRTGLGKSFAIGNRLAIYSMLDGIFQTPDSTHSKLAGNVRMGLTGEIIDGLKIDISAGHQHYFDGQTADKPVVKIDLRFGKSSRWDLRLGYQKDVESEAGLGLAYKF